MRVTPRLAGAALAAPLCALAVTACGGDKESGETRSGSGPDATRIADVRIYQNHDWTVPGETAASVGRALAELEPTWVSSLLRYQAGQVPRADEVAAFRSIRRAVQARSPGAAFDVELNALNYETAAQVRKQMRQVRAKLDNDGWFFDFYTPAYRLRPEVVEAAVSEAHEHGEWVGGNAFGLSAGPPVPPGSDFIAVQDFNFHIDLSAVRKLSQQVPITLHIGNSPALATSDGCVFIEKFDTAKRAAYVRERVGQQRGNDFRFGYPIFFPECQRDRQAKVPVLFSYEAPRDGDIVSTFEALMRRYN